MTDPKTFMLRCVELARQGAGNVSTNPMVGAVVVCDGKIIGEGYHRKFGGPHAEVNAISSVKDQSLLPKSEIYVSLEPCAHFGKTPPCADLIISKGIRKVYVGCLDPFSKVDGKGIQKLRDAGVEVVTGILEKECQELNRRFFTFVNLKRPYVILKWAQSADGFLDKDFQPTRISNEQCNMLNHRWRSEEDAILVGTATAERDNPQLSNRLWSGHSPVRIVIDRTLRLSHSLHVFDNSVRTVIVTEKEVPSDGSNTVYLTVKFDDDFVSTLLSRLYDMNIQSLIVEGGAKTHKLFFESDIWDELRIFQSEAVLENGTRAAEFHADMVERESIGDNTLTVYRRRVG